MSDLIADIIEETHGWNEDYTPYKIEEAAKQIRQQIGRELLATMKIKQLQMMNSFDFWDYGYKQVIREVCQLEEEI